LLLRIPQRTEREFALLRQTLKAMMGEIDGLNIVR